MNSKEFKAIFGEIAKVNDFKQAFGGWYKESSECIAILELQKSNFGDYYQLNIKIFIQGTFGRNYLPTKDLIKSSLGDVNSNETSKYKDVLDFDKAMDDTRRKEETQELFRNHIVPFVNNTLTRAGILEMSENGNIFLLPAVKKELEKLMSS